MTKKVTVKNILASLALQIITILSGFILPKIILSSFGSEVNGLVASLNQFLSYITLLEGGLSGVIMAGLYKPLADGDQNKISGIVKAAEKFFGKIAWLYSVYVVVLAIVYPFFVKSSFSWKYVWSLTLILGITQFVQYFFVLAYKLLLRADRKVAYVSTIQSIAVVLNIIIAIIAVKVWPSIHVLKFVSAMVFLIQPIAYGIVVKQKYAIDKKAMPDNDALKQRWNGFAQNLAYFIHMNTDVVILTAFTSLNMVSVYSVYFMIAISLKNLVMSISSAIEPTMGNVLAQGDLEKSNRVYEAYEFMVGTIAVFVFTCGIALIVPFVSVYTAGIEDANYIQPVFATILMVAEGIYCYRDPCVCVAYASGHYKQTAKYAYSEAIINICVSILLVMKFGIIGVAIGTAVSMVVRTIFQVFYLKKNILYRRVREWFKRFIVYVLSAAVSLVIINYCIEQIVSNYFQWLILAFKVAGIVGGMLVISILLFNRKDFTNFIKVIKTIF